MKHKISRYILLILDLLIIVFAFLVAAKVKPGTLRIIQTYWRSFVPFALIWLTASVWGDKYSIPKNGRGLAYLKNIVASDALAISGILVLMYFFGRFHYSRFIVLGTISMSVAIEIFVLMGFYYTFRFHRENSSYSSLRLVTRSEGMEDLQSPKLLIEEATEIPPISNEAYHPPFVRVPAEDAILLPLWQRYLKDRPQWFGFINDFLELTQFSKSKTLILDSETFFNIENESDCSKYLFVNLHKINDFRRVNAYLIRVNEILEQGGVFICCGETITQRKRRFVKRLSPLLGYPIYTVDFLIYRVLPKLPVLQGWYFALTKGRNRALSETEMLGRFYFCGFDLIHKRELDGESVFILKKSREPRTDQNPTYGPLIRLKRKGIGGKIIYVKKLRTMHPYSEYLQDYVYRTNALQEGGKFKNDFRVTSWGKVFRSLWLDELPQFINFFKGELGIVGVRALSEHYFSLYPPDMQELRLKVKPGLLPPFYADLPKTFEEIVESERRYIIAKLERPFLTDFKYFWKAAWNILIKKARSF